MNYEIFNHEKNLNPLILKDTVISFKLGRLYFGLPFDLWDQSHRCSQSTFGIDPIGMLRAPMGVILRRLHKSDESHRYPEHTFGIDPKGLLSIPMGLIP